MNWWYAQALEGPNTDLVPKGTWKFDTALNLAYNGSVFVKEGLGYLLMFDHLVDTSPGSGLCFRPLEPVLETKIYVIWKKYQVFSPIAELLLDELKMQLHV